MPTAETEGIEYRSRRSLAGRLVVAGKPLLAGVVVERTGRFTRNVDSINRGLRLREEARKLCQSPKASRLRCPSSWCGRRGGGSRPTRTARGVDRQGLDEFEADLGDNLYKVQAVQAVVDRATGQTARPVRPLAVGSRVLNGS
jgi:hypothetical protein